MKILFLTIITVAKYTLLHTHTHEDQTYFIVQGFHTSCEDELAPKSGIKLNTMSMHPGRPAPSVADEAAQEYHRAEYRRLEDAAVANIEPRNYRTLNARAVQAACVSFEKKQKDRGSSNSSPVVLHVPVELQLKIFSFLRDTEPTRSEKLDASGAVSRLTEAAKRALPFAIRYWDAKAKTMRHHYLVPCEVKRQELAHEVNYFFAYTVPQARRTIEKLTLPIGTAFPGTKEPDVFGRSHALEFSFAVLNDRGESIGGRSLHAHLDDVERVSGLDPPEHRYSEFVLTRSDRVLYREDSHLYKDDRSQREALATAGVAAAAIHLKCVQFSNLSSARADVWVMGAVTGVFAHTNASQHNAEEFLQVCDSHAKNSAAAFEVRKARVVVSVRRDSDEVVRFESAMALARLLNVPEGENQSDNGSDSEEENDTEEENDNAGERSDSGDANEQY
ncbi:unnamed protein product [Amoebophrya sp. A120]|nr:unnamed protein product [Amoebophrya sp. A120]|eukprot:GSA120T00018242001.1